MMQRYFLPLLLLVGCGGESSPYLDEIDFLPSKEVLDEVPIGQFRIPLSARLSPEEQANTDEIQQRNQYLLSFDLFAIVDPKKRERLETRLERATWTLRDEVIGVCRSSSVEELTEPHLTTIKGRMSEIAFKLLGADNLRYLVCTHVSLQQL